MGDWLDSLVCFFVLGLYTFATIRSILLVDWERWLVGWVGWLVLFSGLVGLVGFVGWLGWLAWVG